MLKLRTFGTRFRKWASKRDKCFYKIPNNKISDHAGKVLVDTLLLEA